MADKKVTKKAPATKITKAPVAKKTVKDTSAKKSATKVAVPTKVRIQTAEGWKRTRLKNQGAKAK